MVRACTSCSCTTIPACSRRSSARCRSSYSLTTPPSSEATTWISPETSLSPLPSSEGAAGEVIPCSYLCGDVRRLQIRLEAIAGSAHGLDQLVMPRRRKRLAQPSDMNVDRAFFDEHVLAPHFVEQPRAGEDPPGVRHEEVQ